MPKRSAGLLMYRGSGDVLDVLLAHPGGPFWVKKDLGAWSVPKGEIKEGEEPLEAAKREFHEETGFLPKEPFLALGEVKQNGGKTVSVWAFAGNCDAAKSVSTFCEVVWPPRSGRIISIPEVDRCEWFSLQTAREKILAGQRPFLDELLKALYPKHTD